MSARGSTASATFSAGWLQQREGFDVAARDRAEARLDLPARLAALRPPDGPWRVIDLACGTGANQRWLAPRLRGPQQWLAVDHDPSLLARCPAALRGPGFEAAVHRQRIDLARHLDALPWHAAHLVTASALLDLAGAPWLRRLVQAGAAARVAWLFALTVDGRHHWSPADPGDAEIGALFAAHQRRDKGFGPALGPGAGPVLLRALRQAGYQVHQARSDWHLDGNTGPQALAMQRAMIDGIAAAAQAQHPAAARAVLGWRERRHDAAAHGGLRVGHVDVLALPAGSAATRGRPGALGRSGAPSRPGAPGAP